MTGPIDESRHPTTYDGEQGARSYQPKPYSELTADEKRTIEELRQIEVWQTSLYATRLRPRMSRRRAGRE